MAYLRARVDRLERKRGKGQPYFNPILCTDLCADCGWLNMADEELRERTGPGSHMLILRIRGEHTQDKGPCPVQRRIAALHGEGR